MIRRALFPLALAVIVGGLFSSTVKAADITTVTFDFGGGGGGGYTGLFVTGEGAFSFTTGLTSLTAANLTSFTYSEYYDFDNCEPAGCYNPITGIRDQNFTETFTLESLSATLNQSSDVVTLEMQASTPNGADYFQADYANGLTFIAFSENYGDGFIVPGGLGDISSDITAGVAPEPASIGLFAAGLVLVGVFRSAMRRRQLTMKAPPADLSHTLAV